MINELSRQPVTIVEMDPDYCSLNYGESPCTASIGVTGSQKCFNTYRTCQDYDNYNNEPQTLRFVIPTRHSLIHGLNLLPFLDSVSIAPTRINVAGVDKNSTPLGKRESVTITMIDRPYNDNLVDKYYQERNYDPIKMGTFWGKWIARNPFYQGRPIRILNGFIGQPVSDYDVRHYIIETVSTPDSNGRVKIVANDILKLADGDKAKFPQAINAKLETDLTETQTSFAIIGKFEDFENPNDIATLNHIKLSDELMEVVSKNKVTDDKFTITVKRGVLGTEKQSHSLGDEVFRSYRLDGYAWHIVSWLLVNIAGVDQSYIDLTEWDKEALDWISIYNVGTMLTESEDVNVLIGELCQQCLFYIWWDASAKKVKLRAMHPALKEPKDINDNSGIIAGSFSETIKDKDRLSQVWVYYNKFSLIEDNDKKSNYSRVQARIDAEAEGDNQYKEKRITEIFSRWLSTEAQALNTGTRILLRFRTPPRVATFELDLKDRDTQTGDVIDLSSRGITDEFGIPIKKRMEVISSQRKDDKIKIECQLYDYAGDVNRRFAYIMPDDALDYKDTPPDDRKGAKFWISDDNGKMSDGSEGWRII